MPTAHVAATIPLIPRVPVSAPRRPDNVSPALAEPASPSPATVSDDEPTAWPDESAEATFLSEAKARGEVIAPPAPNMSGAGESEAADESTPLPPLEQAVARVPREVRDALEDLFRARFVGVKRVPKSALKK